MQNNNGKDGSSDVGYHFINAYQTCPRQWFLKYLIGIEPTSTGKALSFGKAWHKAIEVYYKTLGNVPDAIKAGLNDLEESESKYQYSEDYQKDIERMNSMFFYWAANVGPKILEAYNVLSLEETLEMTLPNGMPFSGRLDELLERKSDKAILVGEHKSTGYSLGAAEKKVDDADQVTGYGILVKQCKPDLSPRYIGTLLDVTYSRGKNIEARVSEIHRSQMDETRFLLELTALTTEIAQKSRAYELEGTADPFLFPRNGSWCSVYTCPYEAICRQKVDTKYPLPDGLEFVERTHRALDKLELPEPPPCF